MRLDECTVGDPVMISDIHHQARFRGKRGVVGTTWYGGALIDVHWGDGHDNQYAFVRNTEVTPLVPAPDLSLLRAVVAAAVKVREIVNEGMYLGCLDCDFADTNKCSGPRRCAMIPERYPELGKALDALPAEWKEECK